MCVSVEKIKGEPSAPLTREKTVQIIGNVATISGVAARLPATITRHVYYSTSLCTAHASIAALCRLSRTARGGVGTTAATGMRRRQRCRTHARVVMWAPGGATGRRTKQGRRAVNGVGAQTNNNNRKIKNSKHTHNTKTVMGTEAKSLTDFRKKIITPWRSWSVILNCWGQTSLCDVERRRPPVKRNFQNIHHSLLVGRTSMLKKHVRFGLNNIITTHRRSDYRAIRLQLTK